MRLETMHRMLAKAYYITVIRIMPATRINPDAAQLGRSGTRIMTPWWNPLDTKNLILVPANQLSPLHRLLCHLGDLLPEQDDFLQAVRVMLVLKLQLTLEIRVALFEPGDIPVAQLQLW
jgi:hypothetical protein